MKNIEVLKLYEALLQVDHKSSEMSALVRLKNKENYRKLQQCSQDIIDTKREIYAKYGRLEAKEGKEIYSFVYDDVDHTQDVVRELKELEEATCEIDLKKIPLQESDIMTLKASTEQLSVLENIFEYNYE
jgi:hypothetical protein